MMRVERFLSCITASTLAGAGMIPAVAAAADLQADQILSGGEIYTPTGWAQSMAVKNGIIVEVGDDAAVNKLKGAKTQVIDLKGAAVVPGLHDMHVHPGGAGLAQQSCRFAQGSTPPQMIDAVKACVAKRGKGEWIRGGQWEASVFKEPMHRSMLDKVSPDNPVVLTDISGHSVWANSKALEAAGITASTPNPPGGIIEKDAKGQPSGVLRESAAGMVRAKVPPATPAERVKALEWSLNLMLEHGITSFTDALLDEGGMEAYASLADQGKLKQRVRGCVMWRPTTFEGGANPTSSAIANRNLYERPRFKPDCIKIALDGVPTDGHTAAMLEPYADAKDPNDARAKGILMVPPDVLNKAVIDFDKRGLTVKFHAAGDAAMRAGIDAVAAARKANGFSGIMHDVGHASFVNMADLKRAPGVAATIEVSPYIWYPSPVINDVAKAIGPERMKRWIPVKDAIDSGALVVPGSDWSVVPSVNPWIAIETLVTRQKLGGGGEELGAQEKITLKQALDLFTVNSALQMGNRYKTGSIEKGLAADVLVLDRNPLKIPPTQIHQTRVLRTIINGETVYARK